MGLSRRLFVLVLYCKTYLLSDCFCINTNIALICMKKKAIHVVELAHCLKWLREIYRQYL